MRQIPIVLVLLSLLGGCTAVGSALSNGVQGGACLGGQTPSAAATAGTGNVTFSAPAGTQAALCIW